MSFLDWFRRSTKKTEPESRIMPKPIQVNLSDVSVHTGGFTRFLDWDTYHPIPVSWEIPDLEIQVREIEDRILAHASAGTLDGLVPDLLDREIHHNCAEIRERIDAARERNLRQLTEFREQAECTKADLMLRVEELRRRRARSEREFDKAWQELTGEAPAIPEPSTVQTAPPMTVPPAPEPEEDSPHHDHHARVHHTTHPNGTVIAIDR